MVTVNKIKICVFILLAAVLLFFVNAPQDFPSGAIFSVVEGDNLRKVSLKLKDQNIIRSRLFFEAFIIMYSGDRHIISADYLFENKIPVWQVARRISKGEGHLPPVKATIPEGFTSAEMASLFASKLSSFNKEEFLASAGAKEGYLFPDTYFFLRTADERDVLQSLTDTFEKKILTLEIDILESGKIEHDIIKMASLLEAEAKGDQDRDIISGILWRRLSIGMALQADAAPETYKSKGLPKAPINNPGLSSIRSAIYPKPSSYLYYLHDKGGGVHYAKTFAEHRANVVKYLK